MDVKQEPAAMLAVAATSPSIPTEQQDNSNSKTDAVEVQQDEKQTPTSSTPKRSQSTRLKEILFFLPKPTEDPFKLSRPFRLLLLGLLLMCASIDPLASMSFYPVLPQVAKDFDTDISVANLCSSLDFAGVATTALYWSYASRHGRRKQIFVTGLSLVVLFSALGAAATSIEMLIAMRFMSSASAVGIIITGIVAVRDLWETQERGFALGVYFIGPIASPMLGPVLGGLLGQRRGWRAIPAFITSLAGLCLISVLLLLPETKPSIPPPENSIPPSLFRRTSHNQNGRSGVKLNFNLLAKWSWEPLLALRHLRHPIILLVLFIAASSYSFTAIFCVTQQSLYSATPYNYDTLIIGVLFLPYAVGAIAASLLGGKYSDYIMRRHAEAIGESLFPETRIRANAFIACAAQVLSLPSLGWAFRYGAPWPAFLVPTAVYGASAALNMGIATTVLVELMPAHAAGLMVLNSMGRNLAGAVGGSVAQPLIDVIGVRWLYMGLCVLALLNLLCYVTIQIRGRKWREGIWVQQGMGNGEIGATALEAVTEREESKDEVHSGDIESLKSGNQGETIKIQ